MLKAKKIIVKNKKIYGILACMIFVFMMINYFINDKKKSLEPKFTLEIEQEDNNMVFDIKNVGKEITNARLEPYCYLIIDLQKGIVLESEKIMGGCYKFLFTNFYESKEYFYDYERNSFTVRELKGDILLEFLKEIYTRL